MKIPVKSGKTSLAYVTNEERKLLRRRDAVKGSPNKKMSHGIPRLEPTKDYLIDAAAAKKVRERESVLKGEGFEKRMTAPGETKYVHVGKGLTAGYAGDPTSSPVKYGSGGDEYIRLPSIGSALPEKKEPEIKASTSTPPSGGGGSGSSSSSSSSSSAATATPSTTYEAPSTPAAPSRPTLDESQLKQPMLDEIVADGINSELLETRLTNLINKNNPLFKAATTKTMQAMAARGLVNSSIAEEAVMSAILSVAMPIAERDANAYMNQRMQNQAYSNEFRAQQNKAYYESFLTELQGSMDMALRQLTEQSANWRSVLQARSNITTTSGMGAESAELGMDAVTPDWWTQ